MSKDKPDFEKIPCIGWRINSFGGSGIIHMDRKLVGIALRDHDESAKIDPVYSLEALQSAYEAGRSEEREYIAGSFESKADDAYDHATNLEQSG